MAIATAFTGFHDLGRSVIPTFLSRIRFYLQLSLRCPNMNKKSMQEVTLWLLNAFFKRPHGCIRSTSRTFGKTFHFKELIAIFLCLQTLALFGNEARFFTGLACSSGRVLSKTKSMTQHNFF